VTRASLAYARAAIAADGWRVLRLKNRAKRAISQPLLQQTHKLMHA